MLQTALEDATAWVDTNKAAIGAWVDIAVQSFRLAIKIINLFATAITNTFKLVGDLLGNVAALIVGIFTFDLNLIRTAWAELNANLVDDTEGTRDALLETADAAWEVVRAMGAAATRRTQLPGVPAGTSTAGGDVRGAGAAPARGRPALRPGDVVDISAPLAFRGVDARHVEQDPFDAEPEFPEGFEEWVAGLNKMIERQIEETLGDAVFNAFQSAFSGKGLAGIFAQLGREVLAGLGRLFVDLGKALIAFGIVMTGLRAALLNLFTSGPAAIAAGAALVALGSTFTSIASGASGSAGAVRAPSIPMEDIATRTVSFGPSPSKVTPMQPVTINLIGPHDPQAQRGIAEIVRRAQRRGLL